MADDLTLQIKNDLAAAQSASEAASRWLEQRQASAELRYFANLVLEETVTNCIKYGYNDTQEHVIEITLRFSDDSMVISILDDGQPFDPLAAPEPDLHIKPEERPIGGLGIYLLRQMSDRMEYRRDGDKNRLTIWKTMRPSSG